MKKLLIVVASLTALAGCASMPSPQYVSPNTYQSYTCTQLATEYQRVNQYIVANPQKSGLTMSGMGLGIGIGRGGIYPTVSLGVGQVNGGNKANLALALGERDAIVQSARLKQCGFVTGIKLTTEK